MSKEKAFTLFALDANYGLVAQIAYSELQWRRRYHECGIFSIVILGNYDTSWKYIYTSDRREMGEITQVNYSQNKGVKKITLSGYFLESQLDKMVVYPKPTHFIDDSGTHYSDSIIKGTDAPTWINLAGTADVVAMGFFNAFKKIKFRNYDLGGSTLVTHEYELDILAGTVDQDHGTYHQADHSRNNEPLGRKLYDILKESGASPTVDFDFLERTKTLNIVHGRDLTGADTNPDVNPVTFSTYNGTISEVNLVKSNTSTKDVVISTNESDEEVQVLVNALPDAIGRFISASISPSRSDFWDDDTPSGQIPTQDALYKQAVAQDVMNEVIPDKRDVFNITFKAVDGSYEYMEDFDLGDLVAVEVPEIGLSADVRIIACDESVTNGVWKLTMTFGTPIKIRKRGL